MDKEKEIIETENQPESHEEDVASDSTATDSIALTRQLEQIADKRIGILRRIHETGSISDAARHANVSYKAAWQALETLSNLAGSPLVEKVTGGTNGGGSQLTATGLSVLRLSERLARAREQVYKEFAGQPDLPVLMSTGAASLLTSMRNQIPVTVEHVSRGPALVRVTLRIDEKSSIKASLTQESAQLLGIKEGLKVIALAKATAVDVAKIILDNAPQDKDNIITGTVVRCARADKGGEVTLRLPGGASVVGFCRANHGLTMGSSAQAVVPSKAIVIATID